MNDHLRDYLDGKLSTTSGEVPKHFGPGAPDPDIYASGQHRSYWVLSKSERAKGFVRPVRLSYRHVGIAGPRYPLRELTDDERGRHLAEVRCAVYETYPESESPVVGRYWTQAQLDSVGQGCGAVTTMGAALAETYARQPDFYGSTFCCRCGSHYPVGAGGEFVWDDGSGERVGT